MTTYTAAEAARQKAIAALRAAGLGAEADRLAALPRITDRETARSAARRAWDLGDAAIRAVPHNSIKEAAAKAVWQAGNTAAYAARADR